MSRYQSGYIYEASGAFFVRYYVTEIVDGKRARVQRSERLCSKDDKHHSRTCKPVKQLAAKHMKPVNENAAPVDDQTVVHFWKKTYLPFARGHAKDCPSPENPEEDCTCDVSGHAKDCPSLNEKRKEECTCGFKENLRHSTVHGYKQIWGQHLEKHFGTTELKDYRTHMGSLFLTSLARKLGRQTIQHVRSLASGIFTHAVNVGVIESNPWHDVKVLCKTEEPGKTAHYTLEEAEDIISALIEHVDCQLIVALAFFLGLRPGEIQGLRWEDVDSVPNEQGLQWIHIRRAVARNRVGETKTASSVASLPLISPVIIPLNLWRVKSRERGNPVEGWIFPNAKGKPVDLRSVVGRTIVPTLTAKKIEWKTLYAGRRGAGTILTQLTGDALAAKELLRHKNIKVTTDKYVKAIPEALLKGIKLLEAAAGK